MSQLNCPICSTEHIIKANDVYWVSCSGCSNRLKVHENKLEAYGVSPPMPDLDVPFWIGASGHLRGRHFEIVGRAHYRYAAHPDDGYWDGWYVCFDDNTAGIIITEDGEFYFYAPRKAQTQEIPDYKNLKVGSKAKIEGYDAEVVEIGVELTKAISGQVPIYNIPGRETQYVDCTVRNYIVNVEKHGEEKYVHFGIELKPNDIVLSEETNDLDV